MSHYTIIAVGTVSPFMYCFICCKIQKVTAGLAAHVLCFRIASDSHVSSCVFLSDELKECLTTGVS